jgi:hypothetical protein
MHFIEFLMNKIVTSIAAMHVDEDGILIVELLPGVHVTLEKNIEYQQAVNKLLDGKKALVLFDASAEYSITEDAKSYGGSEEYISGRIAVAYVTSSITNMLMFNLYLTVYRPVVPTKMFSSKERALKWLKTFYVMPGDKFIKPGKRKS